jgi:hypothetical protein
MSTSYMTYILNIILISLLNRCYLVSLIKRFYSRLRRTAIGSEIRFDRKNQNRWCKLHGRLWIKSKYQGKGSFFNILLLSKLNRIKSTYRTSAHCVSDTNRAWMFLI